MKTILYLLVVAVVWSAASSRCHASMDIEHVSKEQAKEFGVAVRATSNGPNEVWVQWEFKPEGKLKDFSHVSLEMDHRGPNRRRHTRIHVAFQIHYYSESRRRVGFSAAAHRCRS